MSGHNKWSSIKHRKAAQDAKRGSAFNKIIRELVVAAKEGGGDPTVNFALQSAIDRAKAANMPKDTMEKAIKRGAGDSGGEDYQRITYEGRAPGGVALIIETLTDNKNRTVASVRHHFSKHGGQMGDSGSVSWMFERKGVVEVKCEGLNEDMMMEACLEAGADDFKIDGDSAEVYTTLEDLQAVKAWFKGHENFEVERAEPAMVPKDIVEITEVSTAKKLLRMLDTMDEDDDIQTVFSNWSMSDDLVEQAASD